MAFEGRRKGFRVSDHLQLKSNAFLKRKLNRLDADDPTDVKVGNLVLGILRSRGETI